MNWFVKKNRRAAVRHRYDGSGTWIQLEGSLVRQCQVLDLSRTGVRLRVANAHSLPCTFNLLLSKNGTARAARVKWRRDNELGAEFFKADSSSTLQATRSAPKTNSASASRSTATPPSANSASASRSTADAPRANSPSTSLVAAEAPRAAEEPSPESQKSEALMSNLLVHAEAQQPHVSNLEADAEEVVGSISNDKAESACQMCDLSELLDAVGSISDDKTESFSKTESDCQICDPSEQLDRANPKKNGKQRMDLSRLQQKLGPEHIALIHALENIDPESPYGQELALIIESLD